MPCINEQRRASQNSTLARPGHRRLGRVGAINILVCACGAKIWQNGLTRRRRAGDNSERRLTSTLVLAWLAALDLGSYRSGQTGLTVNQLGNLRRFESSTAHLRRTRSDLLLACAFGPSSSVVERNLGKIEVTGSIPVSGSWRSLRGVLAAARSPANVTPIAVGFCCVWRSGARMETVSAPRQLSSAPQSGASRSVV